MVMDLAQLSRDLTGLLKEWRTVMYDKIDGVEKKVDTLNEKMDEVLQNHLPHLRSEIQGLETKIAALEGPRKNDNKLAAWLQFWSPIVLAILGAAAIVWGISQ